MLKYIDWDDDWEAWELDGKLLLEGHSVPAQMLLDALGINYERVLVDYGDGRGPGNYDDWKEMQEK